jgi:carboxymethylenebutenolidase
MKQTIQLVAGDGHQVHAYLHAVPSAPAGVVVLQEIFGVNHHIRSVVDRFAAEGFTAIAPALFDRTKRGVELAYDEHGMTEGKKLAYGLPPEKILLDIQAAIEKVRGQVAGGKVGVVGYCFGGSYAWLSATRLRPEAASCYYGKLVAEFASETPHCPVIMHFGLEDKSITPEDIKKIVIAHPEIPIHLYQAGHGFSCDERESFAPEASALAFARTIALFREHLAA